MALVALVSCELITGISDKALVEDGGRTPVEAGGDGGVEAGVPVGVPCSMQPTNVFCDDFDSEKAFLPTWEWNQADGGSTTGFDSTHYVTFPNSARFTAPAPTSSMSLTSAQIGKDLLMNSPSTYRLSFDVRIDEPDYGSIPVTSIVQAFEVGTGLSINYIVGQGPSCSLQVFTNGGSGAPAVNQPASCPPVQTWTTIVVSRGAQSISVAEGGQQATTVSPPVAGPPGDVKIIVGVVYANQAPNATTMALEIDDVLVTGS